MTLKVIIISRMIFNLIYNLGISIYSLIITITAFFGNEKAKKWISGRDESRNNSSKISLTGYDYWFHCASLGEFEQARPIIDSLKTKYNKSILISFFSPSGFDIRKNYKNSDLVVYLPIDTKKNAKLFLKKYKPRNIVWVKYDFWLNFFKEINNEQIPLYLIALIVEKDSLGFLKSNLYYRVFSYFNHIFTQNKSTEHYVSSIISNNKVETTGDPRIDQVYNASKKWSKIEELDKFIDNNKVIIGGSTYNKENLFIKRYIDNKNIKVIIAPPDINKKTISDVLDVFSNESILFSSWLKSNSNDKKVLVVDNIGMLSSLYKLADIAIIGGGFEKGIHNILEPASFGLPILFGPNYVKFKEAIELIRIKGAYSFNTYDEFRTYLDDIINNETIYNISSKSNLKYITSSIGASQKIIKRLIKA